MAGAAGAPTEEERKRNTVPHRGHFKARAALSELGEKTAVQAGFGHGMVAGMGLGSFGSQVAGNHVSLQGADRAGRAAGR